jgi:hypothetical protein
MDSPSIVRTPPGVRSDPRANGRGWGAAAARHRCRHVPAALLTAQLVVESEVFKSAKLRRLLATDLVPWLNAITHEAFLHSTTVRHLLSIMQRHDREGDLFWQNSSQWTSAIQV